MRYLIFVLATLFWSATSAMAQVSIGIGLPGVSIGVNLPLFPELVRVPGYPVYDAPQLDTNFFFYDGMYWVYERDNWYASTWYNGPWGLVTPEAVPLFVLRVPVRYYRDPPTYFRGWRSDAPPRWGQHWGNAWEQQRSGWDRWNRSAMPAPAPLPVYQRQYSGDRYPQAEQQRAVRDQNYPYRPRDPIVRQHDQPQMEQRAPAATVRSQPEAPPQRSPRQQDSQRSVPPPATPQAAPIAPAAQSPQRGGEDTHRSPPPAPARQREPSIQAPPPQRAPEPQEQQVPRQNQEGIQHGRGASPEPGRGQGQGQERDRGEDRGQERGQDRNR